MKFLPKLKKLNNRGISHIILPLVVVVAVAVVGVYMLVGSHAATPKNSQAGERNATIYVFPEYKAGAAKITGFVSVFIPDVDLKASDCKTSKNAVRIDNIYYGQGKTKDYSYTTKLQYMPPHKVEFHGGHGYCYAQISTKVDKKRPTDQNVGITANLVKASAFKPGAAGQNITVPANDGPLNAVISVKVDSYTNFKFNGSVSVTVPNKSLTSAQCKGSVMLIATYDPTDASGGVTSAPLKMPLHKSSGGCLAKASFTPIGFTPVAGKNILFTANLVDSPSLKAAAAEQTFTVPAQP